MSVSTTESKLVHMVIGSLQSIHKFRDGGSGGLGAHGLPDFGRVEGALLYANSDFQTLRHP